MSSLARHAIWQLFRNIPYSIRPTLLKPVIPYISSAEGNEDFLRREIRKTDIVLEAGAKYGTSTLMLARLAKEVHAFEPFTPSYNVLKYVTRGLPNVHIYNAALGISDTEDVVLNYGKDDGAVSLTHVANRDYPKQANTKTILLDRSGLHPDFIILDVEGFEADILWGSPRTLRNVRTIIVEIHTDSRTGRSTVEPCMGILEGSGLRASLEYMGYGWEDHCHVPWVIGRNPRIC